jgi:hypothetical protein
MKDMADKPTTDTRSPLTAPPLRNPGQSLDEEIHRLIDEKLVQSLLPAFAFLLIAVVEWIRWWQQAKPNPLLYTLCAVVAMVYAAYRFFTIRRQVRRLKLARDGERAVGQYLETLRASGYRVLHDLIGTNFNVDHVLIGRAGVFAVETKTYHKPAKGKAEIVYDGEHVTIAGQTPDRDPVMQGKAQAHWLQTILQESTGQRFMVRSVVLYPGWFVKRIVKPQDETVWVLNPKALPAFLEHRAAQLSDADAQLVTYHLSRFMRATAK